MKAYLLLATLFLGSPLAGAAPSIKDYFLKIPPQGFTEGTLPQLVEIMQDGNGLIDTKNGYFRLEGDGAQVSLQGALFRYPDQEPLLVVAWGNLEEPDFTHLTLFKEVKGKMVVADRKIFPVGDSDERRFELPRHGRTVIVRDAAGKEVSRWTWVKDAFVKER
ncbi:hypothetical protein OJ996_10140 [Luteolibacter sp. GHJ8]|uniref:Uncharacterized protein n=1 Tax=Luteolibacter rhizosphaerae TaxID=2989719 RepID=A0ABT3G375_9BACT|nr:hypothetical protein [Luteolibacter rhizosphaerae]MCW1913936.1 hypothetical protein [Luteolibacter rhizosphaerae]